MTRIRVTRRGCPTGYIVGRDLIQCDYDYPGAARRIGWSILRVQVRDGEVRHLARVPRDYYRRNALGYCEHGFTDGTVDCPECGISAGDFIGAAAEYLDRMSE